MCWLPAAQAASDVSFAIFLAQRGARVTVAARRAEALAKTVDDIRLPMARLKAS